MAADGLSSRNQVPKAALGEWKERITIQKSILGTDKAGNHVLFWTNYYTCSAYVNNLSGKEYWEAAQVNAQKEIYFLIRYCSETAGMDTIYNITFLDNVKYQNRILKLRASLEKR